ncbi:uncharacterized protein LOC132611706 [Lycium barbarum]|uniref:uncharacterized protein LOC132611706 n=1 Tax=Lycium barbarum TaxID=112863 RepID=UPI00293E946A|nr:uncharacterized protein LOC132611706 [Lycium barbarum]
MLDSCKARFQSVKKNRVYAQNIPKAAGTGPRKKKNMLPAWANRSLVHPFYDYKGPKLDKGNKVEFLSHLCTVINLKTGEVVLTAKKYKNIYVVNFGISDESDLTCIGAVDDDTKLWHRRLGHASFTLLNKLASKDLVCGLPNVKFKDHKVCDACIKGKQVRTFFKPKKEVSTSRPLELLHMDLCGPMRIQSRGGKKYIFVIVDEFSRFTWTLFLRTKDETSSVFVAFVKKIQVKLGHQVASIRSDHGTEFDNVNFNEFCAENGISHNFSPPRTPQQNGVVERKSRTLEDMVRTMLIASGVAKGFWVEAVNTACHLINKCMISKGTQSGEADDGDLTIPDEVLEITNGKAERMNQVEASNEEGVAKCAGKAEVPSPSITPLEAEDRVADVVLGTPSAETRSEDLGSVDANNGSNVAEPGPSNTQIQVSNWKHKKYHPLDNIISPLDTGIQTRSKVKTMFAYSAFISQIEPKKSRKH